MKKWAFYQIKKSIRVDVGCWAQEMRSTQCVCVCVCVLLRPPNNLIKYSVAQMGDLIIKEGHQKIGCFIIVLCGLYQPISPTRK